MFTNDQPSTSSPFDLLNLLGPAGLGVACAILGGFWLSSLLFVSFFILYQVFATVFYILRHIVRLSRIEWELTAARNAAGVLALPEAIPAPHPRVIWAQRPVTQ